MLGSFQHRVYSTLKASVEYSDVYRNLEKTCPSHIQQSMNRATTRLPSKENLSLLQPVNFRDPGKVSGSPGHGVVITRIF